MNQAFYDDGKPAGQTAPASTRINSRAFDISRTDVKTINTLLKKLMARLSSHYSIDKASLVFYDNRQKNLRLTHMLTGGVLNSSLTLTIPGRLSLLHQVLMQGYPIVDNYPELISQNIIEKKILLNPKTRSVAIVPLVHEGHRLGLLSLSSKEDSAFSPLIEGLGEELIGEFIISLDRTLQPV
jgi:transcriptional regulator with GAF, ATPase, and Fis domain